MGTRGREREEEKEKESVGGGGRVGPRKVDQDRSSKFRAVDGQKKLLRRECVVQIRMLRVHGDAMQMRMRREMRGGVLGVLLWENRSRPG